MGSFVRYDYQHMGQGKADIRRVLAKAQGIYHDLKYRHRPEGAFLAVPYDRVAARESAILARQLRRVVDTLVVVGIGGSDLGAKTIASAFPDARGMRLIFLGNPDPETVHRACASLDWKRTAVNVVSKSGNTLEILTTFSVVRDRLVRAVGQSHARERIVATVGGGGILGDVARRESWHLLRIPAPVGGRFSVLTSVGLFPAACHGVKLDDLLAGAQHVVEHPHDALAFAALQYLAYTKHKAHVHVLVPYADALATFADWFAQLWSESLGKSERIGPTPYAAQGAIDQHSQLQLWMQGPRDKTVTFLAVERFRKQVSAPAIGKIPRLELGRVLGTEQKATARALTDAGRSNGTLTIPEVSPQTLGALFQFFEMSVAVLGGMFGVNAFDEPGVNASKENTRRLLGIRL